MDTPKRLDIRQTAASGLNVPDATQVPSRLAFTALSAAFASSVHLQALTAGKPARRARARCSTRNPVDERNRNYRRMNPVLDILSIPTYVSQVPVSNTEEVLAVMARGAANRSLFSFFALAAFLLCTAIHPK